MAAAVIAGCGDPFTLSANGHQTDPALGEIRQTHAAVSWTGRNGRRHHALMTRAVARLIVLTGGCPCRDPARASAAPGA